MDQYYDAKTAMQLLNLPPATFYRKAREGEIPSEGKRPNLRFPKVAIDALAHLQKRDEGPHLTFGPSRNSDIWQGFENTLRIYGEEQIVSFQRLLEWKEITSNIFMSVREGNKRVGGVTMLPLDEGIIHALFNNELQEKDIPDSAIRHWTDPGISVYIPNISIEKTDDPQRNAYVGRFLIRHTLLWAVGLHVKYNIKNWYAYAATDEGKRLLEGLEFRSLPGKRLAYVLDDFGQASDIIQSLLNRLNKEDLDTLMPNQ